MRGDMQHLNTEYQGVCREGGREGGERREGGREEGGREEGGREGGSW